MNCKELGGRNDVINNTLFKVTTIFTNLKKTNLNVNLNGDIFRMTHQKN